MKIIFSSYDSLKNPYYSGGGAVAIHQIAKRFVVENRVLVLTGNYPRGRDEMVEGVFYKKIGPSFLGPKMGQIFFHFCLPFFVLKENFDVWVESFTPPISVSFLPLFTKKPVIGIAHMLSGADMKRKYKIPFDLIERIGLKLYKNFIVLTNQDKQKILGANKRAFVKVIPNGVDIPTRKEKEKSIILFLGRIEINQKGLDFLVDAFKKISKKTRLKLVIAGAGTYGQTQRLQSLAKKLGLERRIKFVGKVSGKQKNNLFEKAQVTIISSRFETFSIVALESISYGVPVVCFDIPQLKWIPKGCSLKVRPFDTEELATSILKIVENINLRKKMVRTCLEVVKKYSWENIYQKYEGFINEMVAVSAKGTQLYESPRVYTHN